MHLCVFLSWFQPYLASVSAIFASSCCRWEMPWRSSDELGLLSAVGLDFERRVIMNEGTERRRLKGKEGSVSPQCARKVNQAFKVVVTEKEKRAECFFCCWKQ